VGMKGRCVICDSVGRLTRDHVPPQGVVPPRRIELRRIADVFGESGAETVRGGFQAAVFPSLCSKCNGKRLGERYDPALAAFANKVAVQLHAIVDVGIHIPGDLNVTTQPAALGRAVLGHLLAAEERPSPVEPLAHGTMIDAVRAYFLDKTAPWSPNLYLSCWPYLGEEQVIVRGSAIQGVIRRAYPLIVGDVLKFAPLAFWLTASDPRTSGHRFGLIPLGDVDTVEQVVKISLPLRGRPPWFWPERPMNHEAIWCHDERCHFVRPESPGT